jgi:phosphoribosylformimino-5-aminoimidazole carboxamide ribotide isomerase
VKVIPVVDVLNGVVVHAVKGKRKEYLPLKSVLTSSVDPYEVAQVFCNLGFKQLYLADLDAIQGKLPSYALYKRLANKTGLNLLVDAGTTNIETAKKLFESKVSKIIIGTETLKTKSFIKQAIQQLGPERLIVSLDLKDSQVLTQPGFDGPKDALAILDEFRRLGVLEFIVLDLIRVGSDEGVNIGFLKKAIDILHDGVYVGGGVRDIADLTQLKTLGVSGVLIATALHTGKIVKSDLINGDTGLL